MDILLTPITESSYLIDDIVDDLINDQIDNLIDNQAYDMVEGPANVPGNGQE